LFFDPASQSTTNNKQQATMDERVTQQQQQQQRTAVSKMAVPIFAAGSDQFVSQIKAIARCGVELTMLEFSFTVCCLLARLHTFQWVRAVIGFVDHWL